MSGELQDDEDVPMRVDFRVAETARAWVEDTRIRRPYRPRFFAAFCAALAGRAALRILELGSGPGQLAREIVSNADVAAYIALDFSEAMHAIAAGKAGLVGGATITTHYAEWLRSRRTWVAREVALHSPAQSLALSSHDHRRRVRVGLGVVLADF